MYDTQLKMAYGWDKGLTRQINEDSILCVNFDLKTHIGLLSAGLFAVADGMGGHNAGEIASDLAVKCLIAKCIPDLTEQYPASPLSVLTSAYNEANSIVLKHAEISELQGMGTTLTAALLIESELYLGHIGDSRCYIINDRETMQITKDHSTVQQLVDAGIISAEEAWNHPHKNEITRVLGLDSNILPDFHHIKLYCGDTVLLCSDGLCGVLPSETIAATVLNSLAPHDACTRLIDQANAAGGPDNISVIIVQPGNLPSWQSVIESQTCLRKP